MPAVSADSSTRRIAAAGQIARLNDVVTFTDLDEASLESLTKAVTELVERFDGPNRPGWWNDGAEAAMGFRLRSPFSGLENPRAPGLRLRADHADSEIAVIGEVEVPKAFGGPPGAVHGGVVSGLFDEVFGELAQRVLPGAVVTAKLSLRFRRPTPLTTPLSFEARVVRGSSHRLSASAVCLANGVVTAQAEALMVAR